MFAVLWAVLAVVSLAAHPDERLPSAGIYAYDQSLYGYDTELSIALLLEPSA